MFKNKKNSILLFLLSFSLSVSVNAMNKKSDDSFNEFKKEFSENKDNYDYTEGIEGNKELNKSFNAIDEYYGTNVNGESYNLGRSLDEFFDGENNSKDKLSENEKENKKDTSFNNSENEEFENIIDGYNESVHGNVNNGFSNRLNTILERENEGTVHTDKKNDIVENLILLINKTDEVTEKFSNEFKRKVIDLIDDSEYNVLSVFLDFIPENFFKQLKDLANDKKCFLSSLKNLINKNSYDVNLKAEEYPKYFKELNKVIVDNTQILKNINLEYIKKLKQFEEQSKNKENFDSSEGLYTYLKGEFRKYEEIIIIYNNFIDKFNSILKDKFHFPKYEDSYSKLKVNRSYHTFYFYPEEFRKEYDNFLTTMNSFQTKINSFYNNLKLKIEKFIKQEQKEIINFFVDIQKKTNINLKTIDEDVKTENIENILYNLEEIQEYFIYERKEDKEFYEVDYKGKINFFKKIRVLWEMMNKINNSKISFSADLSKLSSSRSDTCSKYGKYSRSKSLDRNRLNFNKTNSNENSDLYSLSSKENKSAIFNKDKNFKLSVVNLEDSSSFNRVNNGYVPGVNMDNSAVKCYDDEREINDTFHDKFYENVDVSYFGETSQPTEIFKSKEALQSKEIAKTKETSQPKKTTHHRAKSCDDRKRKHKHSMKLWCDDFDFEDEYKIGCGDFSRTLMVKLLEEGKFKVFSEDSQLDKLSPIRKKYYKRYKKKLENQGNSLINENCMYKIKITGEAGNLQVPKNEIKDLIEISKLFDEIFELKYNANSSTKK